MKEEEKPVINGMYLINEEREEQIYKHGFSLERDAQYYKNFELAKAAYYCLGDPDHHWPKGWAAKFKDKIDGKDQIGKLKVAGALFMAENERRGTTEYQYLIDQLARQIDDLLKLKQQS